ncbi:MAG: cytochrome-c oxidase, cbb3-type subunit III [Gammaproteobacteria bacterium]|nr:cytochrome-c oxidase, cbb3-type subunit III [Gammaproteobacteria bacterium]
MSDFNSDFWNWYIILPTLLGIIWCFWLIWWMSRSAASTEGKENDDTGHVWDGDLKEYNNPLPRWWLGMFYITLVFGIIYLALYPGLGTYQGIFDWSSRQSYENEMAQADKTYGPLFAKYQSEDLVAVSQDAQARKIGERLFLNHCSTCHGSDARGARGFPNLRDDDWLWGDSPDTIKLTILDGRRGVMPAWEGPLGGEAGVTNMTEYVISLSSREHDAAAATAGQAQYNIFCVACHGVEGKGNIALGAPNLTDKTWLHGASKLRISESIGKGRQGHMPAHRDFLGDAKVHLIAAYVYGMAKD